MKTIIKIAMEDLHWLKQRITDPSEEEIYFFVERVGIILEKYVKCACSEKNLEDARKQAFQELKTHKF